MGTHVNAETLTEQSEITGQLDFLKLPYHQAIIHNQLPLSFGAVLDSPVPTCCCSRKRTWVKSVSPHDLASSRISLQRKISTFLSEPQTTPAQSS